ncbi:MAG: ATP-binding protein [Anaerolineae bacterium]
MNSLQVDVEETRRTLAQLETEIRRRREAVERGEFSPERLTHWLLELEREVAALRNEEALQNRGRFQMLYETSQALNASLDWEETVETVIDAVIDVTDAERGLLVLLEDGELRIKVTRSASGEPFSEEDLRFSQSVVRRALERGRPLLTSNAQLDPRFHGSESIIAYGLRSILCAPLIHRGEPLGVIYVENRAQAGVFTPDDLAVLAAFTGQAAVALANAFHHTEVNHALQERVEELSLLQEMARDLNSSLNFDDVMQRSVSWAVTAAGAAAGAVGILTGEGVRWPARQGAVTPDERLVRRVLRQRRPYHSARTMVIPLLREQRPVGIFYLCASEAHPFTEATFQLVGRLADNTAIAVENVRLYKALLQTNQAKSEFVSLVSHELRTPMTSIRGYSEMLAKGMAGELNPRQQQFLEAIQRNVTRMRILVSDLLDLSRIETGRLRLEPQAVQLEAAVDEAYETLEKQMEAKEQRFVAEMPQDLPRVWADPNRLAQILINLMSNAVKYTPEGGEVRVQARTTEEEPRLVRCSVVDTGVGISEEDQRRLFTKFFRSEDPIVQEQTGTGLGLAITKSLVELHGGEIWVRSQKGQGTTVTFTLPVANGAV